MDRLRQALGTIQKHLGSLGPTQKLLVGSLAVILLMTLFLVSQYAASPTMVELLPNAKPEDQQRAYSFLLTQDLGVKEVDGKVMVPTESQRTALGVLSQSGQAPTDTVLVFEDIIGQQSWMNSKEVNRSLFKRALENELGAIIAKYRGVRQAKVFLDIPEPSGFGGTVSRPKASITLFSDTGGAVDQKAVDAAARFVAGAVARLSLSQVTVNDGTLGAPRTVTDDSQLVASTHREASSAVEREFRDKIYNLLKDVQGVVVEVTADVDVRRIKGQEERHLEPKEGSVSLLKRETTSTATEGTVARGAEPGPRSNTGMDINSGSGAGGVQSETTESTSEFENHVGTKVDSIEDPRGNPMSLVATVSVPRMYIAELIGREKGAAPEVDQPAPTPAEVNQRFDEEKARIEQAVRPHLTARGTDGEAVPGQVVVVMSPGLALMGGGGVTGGMSEAGVGAAAGTMGSILAMGGGLVDKAVLGLLALVAVGMMFMLVKKAGKRAEMPTAEELVGLPPALNTKSDLVGEADETDTPIEGIEVNEDEMKAAKLREQVSELIQNSPDVAGRLLNRWVLTEE